MAMSMLCSVDFQVCAACLSSQPYQPPL